MTLKWFYLPALLIASEALAFGQARTGTSQPDAAPILVDRVPPASARIPSAQEFPFTAILAGSQSGGGTRPVEVSHPVGVAAATQDAAPLLFEMKNVALSPTALDAVALAKLLVNEKNPSTRSEDGRVVYVYGVGLPTIVCAPLRVCSLELQAGEHILGEPQIGDSVRWEVTPATTGTDANAVPVIVLKPRMAGLDTTMLVMTDKRTYYVRLISKTEEFIARTAFSYSDDEHVQWKVFLAEQERVRADREASSHIATTATAAIDALYFDYSIKPSKGAVLILPDRVMDDGEKTYIQMPVVAMHRELPALVIQGPTGNEMVNYRVKDNTYVVDRLFDRAALLMGSGKHQQIVKIQRKQPLTLEVK